ncbi:MULTISPECIES: MFS transporter [Pontibacillus]|uniref:MFS transporter n=1 Tax=Pontibacillus chungwhensis TaxID=265426 RepID=A0ABY8V271_9BACI|nr:MULTISPECIES: MFS transporter [Pontibacillus]MCD5323958.1 MFS transporter [Pontibacillus sp. HN14]WIF97976.1 MFS transporter [Pontibacillus chungwhensis]
MKDKRWDLFALASIPLMMTLGNSMLIPVLPLMEREMNITSFQSSLIITIYSVIAIPLIPVFGYLSDKWGRKKIIIPSLITVAVGGGIATVAAWLMENPYWLILVGRFIQGIGASGAFPVVIPTVGDMFKDQKEISKGLGIIETANTFGKVLSPILGALLAVVVWYFPFLFIPVLSLVSILLVMFLVKVPKDKEEEKKSTIGQFVKNTKDLIKENKHWIFSVFITGGVLMFVLFGLLFHFSNVLEDDFKKLGVTKGFYLAVPLLFLCIASYTSGCKIGENKTFMKWMIVAGNSVAALSFLFVRGDTGLLVFLLLLSVAGAGIGVALPCMDAFITEGIPKEERGTITSIYSSIRFVGVAAGPPVIAIFMKEAPGLIYYSFAALCVVLVLVNWLSLDSSEKS